MVRSKFWGAQDALYNLLKNSPALADSQVTYGSPLRLEDENIWVHGATDDWASSYQVSGLRAKDERFTLRVSIAVVRLGDDYLKPRDRVRALGEAVEDLIAGDRTLGGTCELAYIERVALEDSMTDERHRAVGMTLFVACRAWLNS